MKKIVNALLTMLLIFTCVTGRFMTVKAEEGDQGNLTDVYGEFTDTVKELGTYDEVFKQKNPRRDY